MTRFVGSLMFVFGLGTAVTLAEADPLKLSATFLETAPLRAPFEFQHHYKASLVNVGPNLAAGFILWCEAATGVCTASSGLGGCQGVLLAPGHGCSASTVSDTVLWARLVLIRFGDKKPIDARGALQIGGYAVEALPRAGTALVTEASP